MSVKSSNHMERVASLGCILCHHIGHGYVPAQVHHVFDSAARNDFLTIPLCPEHHQGKSGFHGAGQRAFERMHKTSEAHLLAMTLERLA